MGQQQILLIVLGVIIVGIAIVVGLNLFSAGSVEANLNAVVSDNLNIATLAMKFYRIPPPMGGGGTSFVGFTIPTGYASTANGTYTVVATTTSAVITGKGNVQDSNGKVYQVVTTVTATGITTATPTKV
jgi:hypothetical protein